jgi:Suppressor of fused protein (SUFU)
MEPFEFYRRLFAPVEAALGPFDREVGRPIVDFTSGGPVRLHTIGLARKAEVGFATFLTAQLALLPNQVPSEFGRFELMVTCNCQPWAQDVLRGIGRLSLTRQLGPGQWIDLSSWIYGGDPLKWILLEQFTNMQVEGNNYGILRCVGATEVERQYAQERGAAALLEKLAGAGAYPQINIERDTVL